MEEGAEGGHNQNVIEIIMPTYILKPDETEKFYPSQAKKIADRVIHEELDEKEYDEEDAKDWCLNICDKIKAAVKTECNVPRYKIVVQVTIGQMRDQGVRVTSRCLWDITTDNYASISYQNETLWCSALVFGIYTD